MRTDAISGDTPVWRKGLSDWQPLRITELGAGLHDTPPPVAPASINNALVWTIAVAPLAYMLFGGLIQAYELENPYEEHMLLGLISFFVPAAINAALCLADERQLKRAGYADNGSPCSEFCWLPFICFCVRNGYGRFQVMGSCGSPASSLGS